MKIEIIVVVLFSSLHEISLLDQNNEGDASSKVYNLFDKNAEESNKMKMLENSQFLITNCEF